MALVVIPSGLRGLSGGRAQVEVAARDVRELLRRLDECYPGLGERLGNGMAVAIDGEIYPDPLLEPIAPGSEVHFLPQVSGG